MNDNVSFVHAWAISPEGEWREFLLSQDSIERYLERGGTLQINGVQYQNVLVEMIEADALGISI